MPNQAGPWPVGAPPGRWGTTCPIRRLSPPAIRSTTPEPSGHRGPSRGRSRGNGRRESRWRPSVTIGVGPRATKSPILPAEGCPSVDNRVRESIGPRRSSTPPTRPRTSNRDPLLDLFLAVGNFVSARCPTCSKPGEQPGSDVRTERFLWDRRHLVCGRRVPAASTLNSNYIDQEQHGT